MSNQRNQRSCIVCAVNRRRGCHDRIPVRLGLGVVVGDRVRQLLQSQEFRAETSAVRKRNETTADFRQSKQFSKETRADKQRLKEILGRIVLLQEGDGLCVSRPLDTVFDLLSTLSRTENFYRRAFEYVDITLRN